MAGDMPNSIFESLGRLDGRVSGLEQTSERHEEILNIHGKAIAEIVTENKVNAWKIGAVIGALLFAANILASYIKF